MGNLHSCKNEESNEREIMSVHWNRHKYNAKPTEIDGLRFDSKAEAEYYQLLKRDLGMERIAYLEVKPAYRLPGNVTYTPDFTVYRPDGSVEVIEVKGVVTEAFRMKRKLFDSHHPLSPLTVVRKRGKTWERI